MHFFKLILLPLLIIIGIHNASAVVRPKTNAAVLRGLAQLDYAEVFLLGHHDFSESDLRQIRLLAEDTFKTELRKQTWVTVRDEDITNRKVLSCEFFYLQVEPASVSGIAKLYLYEPDGSSLMTPILKLRWESTLLFRNVNLSGVIETAEYVGESCAMLFSAEYLKQNPRN